LENKLSSHFRYYQKRDVNKCIEQHTYTVLGMIDGNPIAYGHLDHEEKYWLGICVTDEYRGKGYGTGMMKHLVDMAKKKNLPEIYLTVDADNIPAINLYKKFNFIEIKYMDKYILMNLIVKRSDCTILPVSYGEAFDKFSILDIKMNKISDDRRIDVEKEFHIIKDKINHLMSDTVQFHYQILYSSN